MKSKKAREFNPNTEKNRQLLISAIQGDEKACKKLKYIIGLPAEENEISEKEMREKAIEAFKITGSEICSVSGTVYKKFVDELNK